MSVAKQISLLVEQIPEKSQNAILEILKSMVSFDDVLTDEDINDIKQARAEIASGDFIRHEDIDWE